MIKVLHQVVKMRRNSPYGSFDKGDYGVVVEFPEDWDYDYNSFIKIRLLNPKGGRKTVTISKTFYEPCYQ